MAKEGLFNILNNILDFTQLNVLDLFAGTGNITFEFASREVLSVRSIDLNFRCVDFIRKTSHNLGFENITAHRADVFKYLKRTNTEPFDLIFSDAPYELEGVEELPNLIFDRGWLKKDAWLIIEHPREIDFTGHQNFVQIRKYGKVNFSFFKQN